MVVLNARQYCSWTFVILYVVSLRFDISQRFSIDYNLAL
jgi:hypothetical protein